MQVWLVGRDLRMSEGRGVWDVVGVFATEAEANAECDASGLFVVPLTVGERLSTTNQDEYRKAHDYPRTALGGLFDRSYPFVEVRA